MKPESRVIGIDDGHFDKFGTHRHVLVIGAVFRGANFLDGLVSCQVEKDGLDATESIALSIKSSKFFDQLRVVFLGGLAVAGFNVINPDSLSKILGVPVLVISRDEPDPEKMASALDRLAMSQKAALVRSMPSAERIENVFVQRFGCDQEFAKDVMQLCCIRSNYPEALRVAHLIATGVSLGESRGRA